MSIVSPQAWLDRLEVRCATCGYSLRGISDDGACPECGRPVMQSLAPEVIVYPPAQVRWSRTILLGICIWLVATFESIGTVLIMRFSDDYGGTIAKLNYIGPKVWTVSLMQRSVGYQPGTWGVNGVTRGLLIAVAILLMTTPRVERGWHEPLVSIRFWARWLPIILFGGFLGLTLGSEGVHYGDPQVRKFVMTGVAAVELPATLLIYLHLSRLSRSLCLTAATATFVWTGLIAALLMIGAVTLLTVGSTLADDRHALPLQAAVSLYMAVSVAAAAAALGAIIRLMMELLPIAVQPWRGRETR